MSSSIINEVLINKIYELRGQKIMLDKDLAELYEVETKVLNQAVKRNIDLFPADFMFKLKQEEQEFLRSQFVTSKNGRGGRTYLSNAFTEHGVLMLSSILRSSRAVQVNVQIIRTFIQLRAIVNENKKLENRIDNMEEHLKNQDKNIELVFTYLDQLTEKEAKPPKRIGYMPDEL